MLFENASSPPDSVPIGRCSREPTPTRYLLPARVGSATALSAFVVFCRDAKAMYSCEAEHSHELSFPQGAHFSNGEQQILKVPYWQRFQIFIFFTLVFSGAALHN